MEDCTKALVQVNVRQHLYKPLLANEYRVVHILPGCFSDDIQCILEVRSFQVKTRYEALSYQWGDETNTKAVHVAHADSSSQSKSGISSKALPKGVRRAFVKALEVSLANKKRLKTPLWIFTSFLATFLLWRFYIPLPIEPPDWVPSFIPRDVYITLLCIAFGAAISDFLAKAFRLMTEVAETKPWLLLYDLSINHNGKQSDGRPLNFKTLQVTPNLALALQYLRREKRARTLWIDALCINQEDEGEKTVQIQRMDSIYANASPVVIWLGGYHGIGDADVCAEPSSQEGVDCKHRIQIQAAFDHIWIRTGPRLLLSWYLNRNEEIRFLESRSGLCELARRGWWERLWVIQEVALATGPVQIQCGHNTCDFEDFHSAQFALILNNPRDKAFKDDCGPSENFLATIKDCRYSSFHDRGGLPPMISKVMMKGIRLVFQDVDNDVAQFHEQPFANKLHLILLKTAGRFKCRDNRDRLHAILGIAGGAKMGQTTKMANFVEIISSHSTQMYLAKAMNVTWDSSVSVILGGMAFFGMYSLWGIFYDSRAKHWTINRPDYVVAGYKEAISSVSGGPGGRPSRVEFFTALAKYLGRETKSLAFLDAATCGEDEDNEMPSWVPNWSREVSKPAYDFASRIKKDQVLDLFGFMDGGKTLQLVGWSKEIVNVLQPADLKLLQSSPWQGAVVKMLVLPREEKDVVAISLKIIFKIMYQKSFSALNVAEKKLISLLCKRTRAVLDLGLALLREGGATIVYSSLAREVGFLRAGEAVEGDRLVFVPGCFHHLVLRLRPKRTESPIRWKLVGLVAPTSPENQRKGCSEGEWAQLLKDKAVHKYIIE